MTLDEFVETWVLVAPWFIAGMNATLIPFLLVKMRLLWRDLKGR